MLKKIAVVFWLAAFLDFASGQQLCTGSETTLTIPDGTTALTDQLQGCSSQFLTTVIIPASVQTISSTFFRLNTVSYGFYNQLTTIIFLPGSQVTSLPDSMFGAALYQSTMGCANLKTFTLPDSLISIGNYALAFCQQLNIQTWPTTLTTLGAYAFWNTPLPNIYIPAAVTVIGSHCFDTAGTQSGTITFQEGSSLKHIGSYAFNSFRMPTTLSLFPTSLEVVESFGFPRLQDVDVDFSSFTNMKVMGNFPALFCPLSFTFPPNIQYLYDSYSNTYSKGATFFGCQGNSIETVIFPASGSPNATIFNSVPNIFNSYKGLKTIQLNDNLQVIPSGLFFVLHTIDWFFSISLKLEADWDTKF